MGKGYDFCRSGQTKLRAELETEYIAFVPHWTGVCSRSNRSIQRNYRFKTAIQQSDIKLLLRPTTLTDLPKHIAASSNHSKVSVANVEFRLAPTVRTMAFIVIAILNLFSLSSPTLLSKSTRDTIPGLIWRNKGLLAFFLKYMGRSSCVTLDGSDRPLEIGKCVNFVSWLSYVLSKSKGTTTLWVFSSDADCSLHRLSSLIGLSPSKLKLTFAWSRELDIGEDAITDGLSIVSLTV